MQVGLLGGGAATVNVGALLAKRVTGSARVLRSRPLEEKIAVSRRFAAEVLPLFTAGRLRPVIDRRFALDDVAEAHRVMEADANVGKLLSTSLNAAYVIAPIRRRHGLRTLVDMSRSRPLHRSARRLGAIPRRPQASFGLCGSISRADRRAATRRRNARRR